MLKLAFQSQYVMHQSHFNGEGTNDSETAARSSAPKLQINRKCTNIKEHKRQKKNATH